MFNESPPPITLRSGEILFLLTDGVVEAAAESGGESFGSERAISLVVQHRELDPHVIIEKLYEAVMAFMGGTLQNDDITALVVKVL